MAFKRLLGYVVRARRRRAVGLVRSLGYEEWAERVGYGRRWAVETAYSSF
jgi:hypothetical protein